MTIKYLIRGNSETVNIYVRFIVDRNTDFKRKTGYVINQKDWNISKGQPNLKDSELKSLKIKLDKLSTYLEQNYNEDYSKAITINSEWVQSKIDSFNNVSHDTKNEKDLLLNHLQFIINTASTRPNQKGGIGLSERRVKGYVTFKKMIERYEEILKKKITIKEVNLVFVENFKQWLFSQKYSINYAGKNIDNLKTVCLDAEKNGIEISPQLNNVKGFSENKLPEEIIYLNFDELEKIETTTLHKNYLSNVRDWLILGCYLGQRGSDLLKNFDKGKIKTIKGRDILEIRQEKTGKLVAIPILPKAKEIIESKELRRISIQNFNEYLKELCQEAGIDTPTKGTLLNIESGIKEKKLYPKYKLISSHVCRRSYASNFYGEIPTPIIMSITAHSTEKMFLKYIGKTSYDNAHSMLDYFDKFMERKNEKNK